MLVASKKFGAVGGCQ